MKKKWIFKNFKFVVTKRISRWGYKAFGEAYYTPELLLSNVRTDARGLVQKFRTAFYSVWGSIRHSLLK